MNRRQIAWRAVAPVAAVTIAASAAQLTVGLSSSASASPQPSVSGPAFANPRTHSDCPPHLRKPAWHQLGGTKLAWSYVPDSIRREAHLGRCSVMLVGPDESYLINAGGRIVDES